MGKNNHNESEHGRIVVDVWGNVVETHRTNFCANDYVAAIRALVKEFAEAVGYNIPAALIHIGNLMRQEEELQEKKKKESGDN